MPTLIDGREVASDSEEWRVECEARYLLTLPKEKRKELLTKREKIRGKVAVDTLKKAMIELHNYRLSADQHE